MTWACMIGPGRGSAAGSVVAYCTGITNIDPIKYDLLFERFLNPDRKSMPDIDTDFDDEGRQKVIDYVVEKYGKQQVAADCYLRYYGGKIGHQGRVTRDGLSAQRCQHAGEARTGQADLQHDAQAHFRGPHRRTGRA